MASAVPFLAKERYPHPMSAAASTVPSDLVAYISQLADQEREAAELTTSLSDPQANWQPVGGASWSVVQCLDHLASTNEKYTAAFIDAIGKAHPGHRPLQAAGWPSRFFLKQVGPVVTTKIKAPKKIRPVAALPQAAALKKFLDANAAVRQFVQDRSGLDLCGVRFKNPFVPLLNFTVATGLLVISAHNQRHLLQIRNVLNRPEFPR